MIPVLVIIIILSFYLFQFSGADPTTSLLNSRGVVGINELNTNFDYKKEYRSAAKEIGRDLPLFYFSLVPSYYPDTLHKIVLPFKKSFSTNLLNEYKDWDKVISYVNQIDEINKKSNSYALSDNLKQAIFQIHRTINAADLKRIYSSVTEDWKDQDSNFENSFSELQHKHDLLVNSKESFFYPKFLLHGHKNQFHVWFGKLLSGDFGASLVDGRPVSAKLYKSLKWTFSLSFLSILFAGLFSICIGFLTAYKKDTIIDKSIYFVLFILFSVPLFWLATVMIVFFTSDEFGSWTNVFPSVGIFYTSDNSLVKQLLHNSSLLILPIFCMVLRSTAYLGMQVRSSVLQQTNSSYYLAAMSKGMSRKSALWKHVLPNAMLPFITIMTAAIPASLAGSLVIEVLFNIPGTGRLMFQSVTNDDWNMISAILIVIAVATMIFYLIGDILYAYVNPKIKLES